MLHETPTHLAGQLVSKLPRNLDPDCIIDLGSGRGALLERALEKYPEAKAIGVDIDVDLNRQARKRLAGKATFVKGDVTRFTKLKQLLEKAGLRRNDSVAFVGNPPFGRNPGWKPEGAAAVLDQEFRAQVSLRCRNELPYQFFVSQLAAAGEDGFVSNIVPSSVVLGQSWAAFRAQCSTQFRMQSEDWGYHRFSGKQVGVGLMVLAPGKTRARRGRTSRSRFEPFVEDILRGSPVSKSRTGRRVLHSVSDGVALRPVIRKNSNPVRMPEDALAFVRVARNAGRLAHIRSKHQGLPFSDCLYAVTTKHPLADALRLVFWSDQYNSQHCIPKRGTGARFLTHQDLRNLRVPHRFDEWKNELAATYASHVDLLNQGLAPEFFDRAGKDLEQCGIPLTFKVAART